ncbi:MAG: hypothetical protein ACK5JH_15400 [Anaerocolumna sp.]
MSGYDSSKHSGIIAYFNQNLVKSGAFDKEASKIVKKASFLREKSDYEDFYIASRPEPKTMHTIKIEIGEKEAVITNGKITAKLVVQSWRNTLQISFYNQEGELLLQEIANGGALTLKARDFRTLSGESFRLKASFRSNSQEKIYGMGQYQQEVMNLKGCNLELAHRNSQASIPFYMSNLGYGFLWHNAAIGEVHFGSNTTEWIAESTKQLDYWITAGDNPAQIEEGKQEYLVQE